MGFLAEALCVVSPFYKYYTASMLLYMSACRVIVWTVGDDQHGESAGVNKASIASPSIRIMTFHVVTLNWDS